MKKTLLMMAALAAIAACSKDDAPSAELAPASAPSSAPASAALAPASAAALAPPTAPALASAPAPASAAALAPPTAPAPAPASPPAKSAARAAPTCGDKPLPPCPLYAWMKANTSAAMSAEDFDALASALDKAATFAPAGYTNWASIASDGASAAHAQSLDGVKASCRGCHNQYKDKYKKEMRDRPI
jgi:hypothetical protein